MLKSIFQKILGPSPVTTIVGSLISVLMILQEALKPGVPVNWVNILTAIGVALLGYKSADSSKTV